MPSSDSQTQPPTPSGDVGAGATPPDIIQTAEASSNVTYDDNQSIIISSTPNKSTSEHSNTCSTDIDVDPIRKADLEREIDLRQRLQAQLELLESEIDKYKKTDAAQKASIKKLTRDNDSLKRELSKFTGMRKYLSDKIPDDGSLTSSNNEELLVAKAEVLSLKSHIEDTAKRLLSAVSGIPDQCAIAQPPTDHVSDSEEFTLVTSRNARRSKATQTTTPVTNTSAIVNATASAGRNCPSSEVSSSRRTYRDTLVNGPPTIVIGTSLVKGVGTHLNKRGINATTYCYPGADIPRVGRRLDTILPRHIKPSHVVLQMGGNDLEAHPPAQVVQQYDRLIHEVKRRCPKSTTVFVNRIPPRGHDGRVRQGINMVNTFLRNRGKRGDGVKYIDSCPHFPAQFKRDRVHFSKSGSSDYADKLSCHLINFQMDSRTKRK